MSIFKKLQALGLVLALMVCTFSTTAFAAELEPQDEPAPAVTVSQSEEGTVYEFDVKTDETGVATFVMPRATLDQTFYMTTSHTGSTRTYSGNRLRFTATITDSNGNAVNSIIAIDLNASYGSIYTLNTRADGGSHMASNIAITPGSGYYFTYRLISGTSTTFKVNMLISDYSS